MTVARSVHGVPIRLPDERWSHIVESYDDLSDRMDDVLNAVAHPAWVTRGYGGALIAWKPFGQERFLSVIYKETGGAECDEREGIWEQRWFRDFNVPWTPWSGSRMFSKSTWLT